MTSRLRPGFKNGSEIVLLGSDGAPLDYSLSSSSATITMPAGGDQASATSSEHAFVFRITPQG